MASPEFRFQADDSVGEPGAEQDKEFLRTCFVDTGHLAMLRDMANRKVIVLGRTGTGKTALLQELKDRNESSVIEVKPENLALTYISNSSIIREFSDLGTNLDPFYKLLWRHVFATEILKRYFEQHPGDKAQSPWDWLRNFFFGVPADRQARLKRAIEYLETDGGEFWNAPEMRVKSIVQNIESRLGGCAKLPMVEVSAEDRDGTSRKIDVRNRGQQVVSDAQIKDLGEVKEILGAVLHDRQSNYYIVIDGLDDDWVEDTLRFKLIMALILTAKEFMGMDHAKVIVALRRDLLESVFQRSRGSGFQEEKFYSYCMQLKWNKGDIVKVLDKRINQMVRRRYTSRPVGYADLLPETFRGESIDDAIIEVADRPRDVIALFNECIRVAVGKGRLTESDFSDSLQAYSRGRFRALEDEWFGHYPDLRAFSKILTGRPPSFKVGTITTDETVDLCLNVVSSSDGHVSTGRLFSLASNVVDESRSPREFLFDLVEAFFHVGLVGLKVAADMAEHWVDDVGADTIRHQISEATSIVVSPKYARAVGIASRDE